jgi:hypothetical protein
MVAAARWWRVLIISPRWSGWRWRYTAPTSLQRHVAAEEVEGELVRLLSVRVAVRMGPLHTLNAPTYSSRRRHERSSHPRQQPAAGCRSTAPAHGRVVLVAGRDFVAELTVAVRMVVLHAHAGVTVPHPLLEL